MQAETSRVLAGELQHEHTGAMHGTGLNIWKAGFYNLIFLGSVGLIFVLLARRIIGLFTHDLNVVPYGVDCLRIRGLRFSLRLRDGLDAIVQWRRRHLVAAINLLVFLVVGTSARLHSGEALWPGPPRCFPAITICFNSGDRERAGISQRQMEGQGHLKHLCRLSQNSDWCSLLCAWPRLAEPSGSESILESSLRLHPAEFSNFRSRGQSNIRSLRLDVLPSLAD